MAQTLEELIALRPDIGIAEGNCPACQDIAALEASGWDPAIPQL